MSRSFFRWVFVIAVVLGVGPAASLPIAALRDADGGHAVTLLSNSTPIQGLLAAGVLGVASLVVAAIGAHFFTLGMGAGCAGVVMAWGAWRIAPIEVLLRRTAGVNGTIGHPDFTTFAAEGAAVSAFAVVVLAVATVLARRHQTGLDPKERWTVLGSGEPRSGGGSAVWQPAAASIAVGAVVAGILASLLTINGLKGQTVMAAVVAGIGAGVAAQMIGTQMRATLTAVAPAVALVLMALAGPLAAQFATRGDAYAAIVQGGFLGLAKPLSLDWAAGILLGVPMGMGWAGAMIDQRALEAAQHT